MLIGILLALIVIVVVLGVVTSIRRARACQRIIDVAPAGEPELVCYGGVMCRALITSGSLVRLDLLDWGVRLRGIPISRWIVPRWEARYTELALAELVATPYSRIAVWFRVEGEPGGMGFLSDRHRDILAGLQRHDVLVDRSIRQIRRVEDMYSGGPR